MRPATSLGPPAASGRTSVSGRVGQVCADAVPGEASSASIAANAERHAPITRLLPMPMVRPWSWPRGVLEHAGRALSLRRDKRAIVKLALLGLRRPCLLPCPQPSLRSAPHSTPPNGARRSTRLPPATLELRHPLSITIRK